LETLDYEEFERVMAVNVFGPLRVSQAFLDHVAASDQKEIVVMTSISGSIEIAGLRPSMESTSGRSIWSRNCRARRRCRSRRG
jgi:NAD(P)-dependent dehydrogenase (short-subunit alcohol dehydrogenase family)